MSSARDYNINDISMLNIEYLTMNKVQMHGGAIRKLFYFCASCTEDSPHTYYFPVQTHKQYNISHAYTQMPLITAYQAKRKRQKRKKLN